MIGGVAEAALAQFPWYKQPNPALRVIRDLL